MRQNIIIISPLYPPKNDGPEALQSLRLAKLFEINQYPVTVITEMPSISTTQISVIYKQRGVYKSGILNLLSILKWVIWAAYKVRRKTKQCKPIVLSRCYPPYSHWVPLLINKRKIIWFANWNDPAPPILHVPPYGLGYNAVLKWWHKLPLYLIGKKADINSFPSQRLLNYMSYFISNNLRKVFVQIPHIGAFPNDYKNSRSEKLVLAHFGSIYFRNRKELFTSISLLLSERPELRKEIQFIFIGWAPDEANIILAGLNLSDVVIIQKNVTPTESVDYMQNYDVLILLETSMEEGIYMPSKLGDYALSKKPIFAISPPVGEINDLKEKYNHIYFASSTSVADIKNVILKLHEDWKSHSLMISNNLFNTFHPEAIFKRYKELINGSLRD